MQKKTVTYFFSVCMAILGIIYINYIMNIQGEKQFFLNSLDSVLVGIVGIYIYSKIFGNLNIIGLKKKRKVLIYAGILAFLFSLSVVAGYQLKYWGYTLPGFGGKAKMVLYALIGGSVFFPFFFFLFQYIGRFDKKDEVAIREKVGKGGKKVFFLSWIFIFCAWIPIFLAYYPAIMSYDFNRQSIEAIKGFIWFNSHHPLAHTFLIWCALQLGTLFDSYQLGMAIYSIFQMLILSVVMAYACAQIYRIARKKVAVVLTALFFGVLPITSVLALCVTKDVIFAAFMLLFMLLLIEKNLLSNDTILINASLVLSGLGMILFRNNAIYAVIVFSVFYIFFSKGKRVQTLMLCLIIIIIGKLSLFGIQTMMQAGTGSKAEMCSIMMQQLARTGKNQRDVLAEDDYEIINKYIPEEYWAQYNPPLADGVKGVVAAKNFFNWTDDWGQTINDWLYIGTQYPNEYIDAFLAVTAGWWSVCDTSYADVLGESIDEHTGIVYTFNRSQSEVCVDGIANESKIPILYLEMEKIISANSYEAWPIISILFKPAFYCWMLFLLAVCFMFNKQWKQLLILGYPIFYLLTLYLGPVVQIRYAFPFIIIAPSIITIIKIGNNTINSMHGEVQ